MRSPSLVGVYVRIYGLPRKARLVMRRDRPLLCHAPNGASMGTPRDVRPSIVIVMGVSGSGKSTVGAVLAERLGWDFADGDAFHSDANLGKMRAGIALTDEDRVPWLRSIAEWIDAKRRARERAVVACSALKRSYRRILVDGRDDVRLVYLEARTDTVSERLRARRGHFMPANLMQSQFDALEEPEPDENAIVVSVDQPPDAIARQVLAALNVR